jgi:hypothetical protein
MIEIKKLPKFDVGPVYICQGKGKFKKTWILFRYYDMDNNKWVYRTDHSNRLYEERNLAPFVHEEKTA